MPPLPKIERLTLTLSTVTTTVAANLLLPLDLRASDNKNLDKISGPTCNLLAALGLPAARAIAFGYLLPVKKMSVKKCPDSDTATNLLSALDLLP